MPLAVSDEFKVAFFDYGLAEHLEPSRYRDDLRLGGPPTAEP